MYLTTRTALGSNLNCLDLTDTFVEVGVLRGDFAECVAKQWTGRRICLVDQWCTNNTPDHTSTLSHAAHEANYQRVRQRFSSDYRVELFRTDSLLAAKGFEDRSLSCVYLDADHSFAGVLADIQAWWPKIAGGGLLSGHDYVNAHWGNSHNDPGSTWCAVKAAVDHFFRGRTDCSCIISSYEDQPASWNVFKIERQIDPSSVLVLSCATDNLKYSQSTEINHRAYCALHGYQYEMVRSDFWEDSHPAWSKLKFIQDRLQNFKWIAWVDADAVFMNYAKKLEPMLIPRMGHVSGTWHAFDRLQLTNGVSFWQNIPWTFDFISRALKWRQEFAWRGIWEEEGIRRAMDEDINNYGLWLGVEIHHFNSWPHFNVWQHGDDLIVHWGGAKFKKDQLIADSLAMADALHGSLLSKV